MPVDSAPRMLSSPSASPACTVAGKQLLGEQVERLARAGRPGNPASGPAMSNPTTPRSRWRSASSAISVPRSRCRMALTSWPTRIRGRPRCAAVDARVDPLLHGLDRLVEGEAATQVLLRRPADLALDDAVLGEVLDELARDADEPLAGLHDADREVEGLQVLDERSGVGLLGEPGAEPAASAAGSSRPIGSASSMIVCGRSPPSRWSCRDTLGRAMPRPS